MKTNMKIAILAVLALAGTASFAVAQTTPPPPPAATSPAAVGYGGRYQTTVDGYYQGSRTVREEDLKSKEVSKEIAAPKNGDIYIENTSRNILVKVWDQQKVKVTTTVYFEGESKLTDDEWLERASLSVKTLGNSVKIKSGSFSGGGMYYTDGIARVSGSLNTITVIGGSGQGSSSRSNVKRMVTIYIPAGSKIDVESKYSDVTLPDNIGDANIDISNGNLEGGNVGKFILRSKYSNINVGDLKTAEVEMANGRFSAKNVDDLDIDSKYSTVEMVEVKKIVLRSTNDEYELEDAGEVRGRKNYGNLRITKLNNSMELDGANADVKVRKIGSGLSMIRIDDRYADVRIPLRDTKNYSIDFSGSYSSVYGNFEKKPVSGVEERSASTSSSNSSVSAASAPRAQDMDSRLTGVRVLGFSDSNNPAKFTASVGDGKGLKLDIKCQNCTVDFK